MEIGELDIKRSEKIMEKIMSSKDTERAATLNAASDFGHLFGKGIKEGLSPEQSFVAAKEHFKMYGRTMVEFAELVTLEMMPSNKEGES